MAPKNGQKKLAKILVKILGQNFGLKKVEKIGQNFGPFLRFFLLFWDFFAIRFFISKKQVFSAGGVAAGAFFCEKKRSKILEKILDPFWTKFWTFFGMYFLGKKIFCVILLIKTLWFVSRTTDLVERIREQFFLSKIDWRSLELWHFFLHFMCLENSFLFFRVY